MVALNHDVHLVNDAVGGEVGDKIAFILRKLRHRRLRPAPAFFLKTTRKCPNNFFENWKKFC